MTKTELLRLCGSMEQVASVRPITFTDGRAGGMRCIQVKNGALEYALMQDKCLDPAWITYKGVNLSFLTKPGLQGRGPEDASGPYAGRYIMCGAMMTCGLGHIHAGTEHSGTPCPTHGRIRFAPAEKVGMDARFDGDGTYRLSVSGEMREAEIFGENLTLRRRVESAYGTPEVALTDEIENQGFCEQPLCLLYHCNAGYPLLTPETRLILPSVRCVPRDADAAAGARRWMYMEAPRDNAPEQVFLHHCAADARGDTFGAIVNDDLKLALCLRWNTAQLPLLTQWKTFASGDYAMALEPSNTGFLGRAEARQTLLPMQQRQVSLRWQIAEGPEAIAALERECAALLSNERRNGTCNMT